MIRRTFPRLRATLALVAGGVCLALSGNVTAQHDGRSHAGDPSEQVAWLKGETQKEQEAWDFYQKNKLISAGSRAEEVLAKNPDAILANFVLGVTLHQVEGNLQQSMFHIAKAREVLEAKYNCRQKDTSCPWKFHRDLLFETQLLAKEMEEYDFQLEILDYQDQLYDPVLTAEHAWPLMKLGKVDDYRCAGQPQTTPASATRTTKSGMCLGARSMAKKAIESKDAQQRRLGHNALCAIEGELGSRGAWYEACLDAYKAAKQDVAAAKKKKEGEDAPSLAVHAYNAALASYSVLKFDEVERIAREGAQDRAKVFSVANPWRVLSAYYINASRVPEAVGAVRNVIEWRSKEPPQNRDQDAADTDAALATLLLVSGDSESGLRLIERALSYPDRRGLVSSKAEQATGAHALIRRALLRLDVEKKREQASFEGMSTKVSTFVDRVGRTIAAWPDNERIASVMAAERARLESTFRVHVAGGLEPLPTWMLGDLVDVLGAGVVSVVLGDVRKREAALRAEQSASPDMGAYYDAIEAEVAFAQGDLSRTVLLADRALAGLPQAEAILGARVAAVASEAARKRGDDAAVLRYLETALQKDAGVIRRMGLAIPAQLKSGGGEAARAAELIAGSPRIRDAANAFQIVVKMEEGAISSCLLSSRSAEITCAETKPKKDESPEAFARRAAKDFHAQAFTLAFSLSQKDLNSLDGRISGASQEDREKMNDLLRNLAGGDKDKDDKTVVPDPKKKVP